MFIKLLTVSTMNTACTGGHMVETGLLLLTFSVGLICYVGARKICRKSILPVFFIAVFIAAVLVSLGLVLPGIEVWLEALAEDRSFLSLPVLTGSWMSGFLFGNSTWSDFLTGK